MNTTPDVYVDRIRASLARQDKRTRNPGPMEQLLRQHYRAETAERERALAEQLAQDAGVWEDLAGRNQSRIDALRAALDRQDEGRSRLLSDEPIAPPAKPGWIEATISNAVAQHPDRPRFLGAEIVLDESLPRDVVEINGQRIRIEVSQ